MVKKWTEEEISFLKKHYPAKDKGPKYVAEKIGRTYASVMTRARKLNVRSKKNTKWEQWHIDYLKQYYGYLKMEVIQEKLGKTYSAILEKVQIHHLSRKQSPPFSDIELEKLKELYSNKKITKKYLERIFSRPFDYIRKTANSLGLYREYQMTLKEKLYIRNNYKTHTVQQMADELGVSYGVVKWQKRKYELRRDNSKKWAAAEKEFLKNNYELLSIEEIAEQLGRTRRSIHHYTRKLLLNTNKKNLWSDDEIKFVLKNYKIMTADEISENIDRTPSAIATKLFDLFKDSPEKLEKRKLKRYK